MIQDALIERSGRIVGNSEITCAQHGAGIAGNRAGAAANAA